MSYTHYMVLGCYSYYYYYDAARHCTALHCVVPYPILSYPTLLQHTLPCPSMP